MAMESVVGVDEAYEPRVRRRGPWRQALARFRRRPLGVAAAVFLLVLIAVGLFAEQLAPYDAGHAVFPLALTAAGLFAERLAPYAAAHEFLEFINKPQPIGTRHHWLGTDVI